MPSKASKRPEMPFNKKVLRWAREWKQRSLEGAARRVGKTAEDVAAWEDVNSTAIPTIRQARRLAEYYDRPFLEFFWAEPPVLKTSALIPDFRMERGASNPRESRELEEIQAWAEEQG